MMISGRISSIKLRKISHKISYHRKACVAILSTIELTFYTMCTVCLHENKIKRIDNASFYTKLVSINF